MSVVITAAERDALYGRIIVRLNGIDSVYTAIQDEDWEAAQRLGLEFSDLLRLVCEDLGWGESEAGERELVTPPDVLGRALETLLGLARVDRGHHEDEVRAARQKSDEARRIEETCERILGRLG